MKHKTIFLLIFMLASGSWLVAQQAVWWSGSPPPGNTARDHSVSYGNGFAWQVALGTAESEDVGHDAISLDSGGYLVVGTNAYFSGYTPVNNDLALYYLSEEGNLVWEKRYAINDYKSLSAFKVIQKPDGGFIIAGFAFLGSNPSVFILIDADAAGDTISTVKWASNPLDLVTNALSLRKSSYDDSFFLSYREKIESAFITKSLKLSYSLDTLAYTELPDSYEVEYALKPFGYIHRGGRFDNVFYYYAINFQGEVLDSFPDPHGVYNPSTDNPYAIQSLRNGRNVFFRTVTTFPSVFKMTTTTDAGEVLNVNPNCFTGDDIWWYNDAGGCSYPPHEFSNRSICVPYNFYFDWNDNYSIGLVKLNSQGQLLGDTAMSRSAGSMMLVKVLEGADGRPVVFGTGKNGPLGGDDIFIAKIESWNPVGVPTVNPTDTQPLRVYPNPTNDTVEVTIPTGATKGTLSVTTLSGQIVHSQAVMDNGEITLTAARWPTGLLIVSLTTPDRVFTTKLIKN